jgi:hypothetical protein
MRMRVVAVGLVAALAVVGCGGAKGVPVEGKAVNGDKAYNPTTDGDLIVRLTGSSGLAYSGKVGDDGTFKMVPAAGGEGVPPGSNKVSVTRYPSKAEMDKHKGPPTPVNKDLPESWDVAAGKTYTVDVSKVK